MVYFWPRISTSTRFLSAMATLQIELVQLFQDAVHLGQDFPPLLPQALEFRVLGLHGREPSLERGPLRSEPGDDLHRPLDRSFELLHASRQILGHHTPLTSALNRSPISFTIRACRSLTSASRSVRSGAWKVKLHARLRRPGPTWSPAYTSKSASRVRRSSRMPRIAASIAAAVT